VSELAERMHLDREAAMSRAIRALLATPLLTAENDRDGFELVRRHRQALIDWFDANCGWRLEVEPRQGYARLFKVSDRPDPSRPPRRQRSTHAAFDRRRYTLLCVVAAELLPSLATTIGILADRVTQATGVDPAISAFDSARFEDRRAYVDAIKLLESLGVLSAIDGSTESFVDHPEAKILYRVDSVRLTRLLAAPQAPSRLEEPDLSALASEPRYGSAMDADADVAENQRNLWLRHSITRRVLDDPVVYYDELTAAQHAYLGTLTGRRLVRQAAQVAGFALEERAEGMLAVDPDSLATDQSFPAEGSVARQTALLLLDVLLGAAPEPIAVQSLVDHVAVRLEAHPDWARTYQSEGGADRLAREALDVLLVFHLAVVEDAAVRALPAAARYAVGPAAVQRVGDGT
jgi:uncharacterized protein (TIGR02678 family)